MALFGMFKKRDISPPQKFDIGSLDSDLPPIDGSGLPPLQDTGLPPLQNNAPSLELPSLDVPDIDEPPDFADEGPKSSGLTVNIAPLDFSMPTPDADQSQQPDQSSQPDQYSQPDQFPPSDQPDQYPQPEYSQTVQPTAPDFADVDENINKLFLSEEWKEPDWKSFDPYSDPQIEEPKPEDFGVVEEAAQEPETQPQEEMKVPDFNQEQVQIEPLSIEEEREVKTVPIELYVKGSDYRNVFSELGRINELLSGQEQKIGVIQNYTKKEDDDMAKGKEGMEYIYRKLTLIDKKIFA